MRSRRGSKYLGVEDEVDGAGRGEVEHAGASPHGGEHGGAVEEVAPEEADAALVAGRSGESEEVVRLGLVICAMPTKSRASSAALVPRKKRTNTTWH
jgi:hypothetical protein